eukprot:TRINITY_DN68232_c0_g1_i1.p1 TRINITY_DN68232_c0_g1~~TRINITY_DN68232_c0_g1_i1.p1  ORF type:complete len:364 (+),score=61.01 TRINITY_DN68232_c0_g1_i1:39-1130(+)
MPKPGDYSGGLRSADAESEKSKFYFGDLYKSGRYIPKHAQLFESPARWHEWLQPSFLKAHTEAQAAAQVRSLQANTERGNSPPLHLESMPKSVEIHRVTAVAEAWASVLCHECEGGDGVGVYSFDVFTPEFCKMLVEEVDHAQDNFGKLLDRPNGMNRFGMVLNQVGLQPAITELQETYITPLQHFLYGVEGHDPDDHHCFVVRYKKGEDIGLDMHSDSSDVTMNVCLGRDFAGSTLTFCGLVGNRDHRSLKHVYCHQVGRAIIHLGRQRHGADDLESGERLSLILWNTSSAWRGSDAYYKQRSKRKRGEDPPDLVCLSYTHDDDYRDFKEALSAPEAVARGVMLDRVRSDPRNQARFAKCGG